MLRLHCFVSTHSRPKAAGSSEDGPRALDAVSTHSRPKAAGFWLPYGDIFNLCFNTQPPEGGWEKNPPFDLAAYEFQHTAARRRLGSSILISSLAPCFNTQPPEGGWPMNLFASNAGAKFQHTAARRRLGTKTFFELEEARFQHTAARRRLAKFLIPFEENTGFNTQPPEGGWLGKHTKMAV